MNYLDVINHFPDFPKKGIDFIDVLPFLTNKEAFNQLIADIDAHTHCPNIITVEARGFLFAAPLLTRSTMVQKLVAIRKKGKLPFSQGDLRGVEIMKEYGPDHVYYRLSDLASCVPEGDTINLTRTSINGTDGQLSGEKNQGDSFAVTTTDHGQALRTAINLTQLKQFTKRYRIHNGHLYLPTPRGKYERVNIDWLDSDSLVVSSPKGRHHFDPQNVKDLNAGKIK